MKVYACCRVRGKADADLQSSMGEPLMPPQVILTRMVHPRSVGPQPLALTVVRLGPSYVLYTLSLNSNS